MRISSRFAIVALAVLWPGCGPPRSESASQAPVAPTPGGSTLLSLRISVPSTLPPGASAQLSATAKYTDGSSQDVTTTVTWRSADPTILAINDTGLATARQPGETTITAALSLLSAAQSVVVIPPGTFRLDGTVSWSGGGVEGASVEVTGGIGKGSSTITNVAGAYRLYGVAGDIEVTASKAAYVTTRKTARVDANSTLDFQMVAAGPLPPLAGSYMLQITADPACATNASPLLDAARVRRYSAVVEVTNGIHVSASGASFTQQYGLLRNFMFGRLTPDGALLNVNDIDYYRMFTFPPPDFAEVLPDGNIYAPSGNITLTANAADLLGTLDGTIWVRRPPDGVAASQCTSTHHTIAFTRQSGDPARIGYHR